MAATNQKDSSLKKKTDFPKEGSVLGYQETLNDLVGLVETARRNTIRSVNSIMTTTYWFMGKRIVEQEQMEGGVQVRIIRRDLTQQFGRGFSQQNLFKMRGFYLGWSSPHSLSSGKDNFLHHSSSVQISPTLSSKSYEADFTSMPRFPLPWSHYVRLLSVDSEKARAFYEEEALRGGWTIRQMDRQIDTQFYERTMLSKDKAYILKEGAAAKPDDAVSFDKMIKDPLSFEFVGLKDRYSEGDLEHALVSNLRSFLLEFVGNGSSNLARSCSARYNELLKKNGLSRNDAMFWNFDIVLKLRPIQDLPEVH